MQEETQQEPVRRKRRWRYILIGFVVVLIIGLIAARAYLPIWLKDYVNHVLANDIKGYKGSIEAVDVHLYRGAYSIHGIRIYKNANGTRVPFFASQTIDLSVQWKALFNGRIVSDIDLIAPEINFAEDKKGDIQTGENVDWNKPIKELMPLDINLVTFRGGKVSYKNPSTSPPVDIYIHNLNAEVRNLRNVEDVNIALPSPIKVSGTSIGKGKFNLEGRLNILKKTIDMDIDTRLENADLRAINDYSKAFAAVDFEKGTLSVYSEVVVKDNQLTGYIKPVAQDVHMIDLSKADNPIQGLWEVVVGTVMTIFTNHSEDQFATKVDLAGNLNKIESSTWSTIVGIVRNAFVQAFTRATDNTIDFPDRLKTSPAKK